MPCMAAPLQVDTQPVTGSAPIEPVLFELDFPDADFADAAPLVLTRPAPVSAAAHHFRAGVPIARGVLTDPSRVSLTRDGENIPVQATTVATWGPPGTPDAGSVRWLRLDFVDSVEAGAQQSCMLHIGKTAPVPHRVTVRDTPRSIAVNNGRLFILIDKSSFNPFASLRVDGKPLPRGEGAYVTDAKGMRYHASNDPDVKIEIEQQGPLAAVIRAEGWFVNPAGPLRDRKENKDGPRTRDINPSDTRQAQAEPLPRPKGAFCRFVTRLYIAADQPDLRVQHTFILTEDSRDTQYGDIGLHLPAPDAQSITFAGVDQPIAGPAHLLQKSWDAFDIVDASGNAVASGEKATGIARAGATGVAVREFWQNYPKEISFEPGELTVHFWPAHGINRAEDGDAFCWENGWRLPFVHSGKLLNFEVPKRLFEDEAEFPPNRVLYKNGASKANALGISRTHDLLISFAADETFTDRAAVFQADPHPMPAPKYIEYTKAVPEITAAQPDEYPFAEHWFANSYKWVIRAHKNYNAYGMWNYGDVNHYFFYTGTDGDPREYMRPRYRRLWAGTHHGYARLAWWLYMRNADPVLLEHARAQTSHIADVDTSHWEDGVVWNKRIGGLCDYKGIVHWHMGNRAWYNAEVDYLLYDFYLTGDRRSWDVAMEHGDYTRRALRPHRNRESAGQLDVYACMWRATWDERYRDVLLEVAHKTMGNGAWNEHSARGWSPWPIRTWRLTGDEKVKQWVLDWAEQEIPNPRLANCTSAWAYEMTGDEKWKKRAAVALFRLPAENAVVRRDDLDGFIGRQWNWNWSFPVRDLIMCMKTARGVDLTMADISPAQYGNIQYPTGMPYPLRNRDNAGRRFGDLYPWPDDFEDMRDEIVFHHDGSNQTINFGTTMQAATVTVRLIDPSGNVAREDVREGRPGVGHEEVPLGSTDPAGFWRLQYEGTDAWRPKPLREAADDRVWFPIGDESSWFLSGTAFFYVPADCEKFEMHLLPSFHPPSRGRGSMDMSMGVVFNADLEPAARIDCSLQTTPQVLTFEPSPVQRGRVWAILGGGVTFHKVVGIPAYLAPTVHSFTGTPRHP